MVTKYICVKAGCGFVSEDESEAIGHANEQDDHKVVEVSVVDDTAMCNIVGDTGEEPSGDDLTEGSEKLAEDEV